MLSRENVLTFQLLAHCTSEEHQMQYCELSDYDMPAGALTIWRPRANLKLMALDARPLAPQHERHVNVHSPGQRSDWIGGRV